MKGGVIEEYLTRVCSHVKYKKIHRELRGELRDHLEELAADREEAGYTREEAEAWAVEQMGDPEPVGRQLHRLHKPKLNWGVLAAVLLLGGAGLLGIMSYSASSSEQLVQRYGSNHPIYLAMAFVIMGVFYFIDYRKLKSLSWLLYSITLLGMIVALLDGQQVNGATKWLGYGFLGIVDIMGWSCYLLVIALAGIWTRTGTTADYKGWKGLPLLILPLWLYSKSSGVLPEMFLFLVTALVLYVRISKQWRTAVLTGAAGAAVIILILGTNPLYTGRLEMARSADGGGYVLGVLKKVQDQAGWWGQGYGMDTGILPYPSTDMLLTYFIYAFGWAAGIAVACVILWLIVKAYMASMAVREGYGRALMTGIATLLCVQFIYNLLKLSGEIPLVGLPLPFMSYGGSHLIIEYAAMGLLLGVYRTKDLIRYPSSSSRHQQSAK